MFTTDSRTENFLTQLGCKWRYEDSLRYEQLAATWREFNYGRDKAVNERAVAEYADLMNQGSAAPAVILRKISSGLEVLDGVQRLTANHLNDATTFAAYVIQSRSEVMAHKIRIASNQRLNGTPPPKDFTLATAVRVLIVDDDCSTREVANLLGRSMADVEKELTYQRYKSKLDSVGVTGLNKAVVIRCGEVFEDEDFEKAPKPIKRFLNTLAECKFKNGDSERYLEEFASIKRLGSKNRDTQFNTRYRQFVQQPEIDARLNGRKARPAIERILQELKSARTVIREAKRKGSTICDRSYADEIVNVFGDIREMLRRITDDDIRFKANSDIYA